MEDKQKFIGVLDSSEPWALDHEEIVQGSEYLPGSEILPRYEGVNGSDLAVQCSGLH